MTCRTATDACYAGFSVASIAVNATCAAIVWVALEILPIKASAVAASCTPGANHWTDMPAGAAIVHVALEILWINTNAVAIFEPARADAEAALADLSSRASNTASAAIVWVALEIDASTETADLTRGARVSALAAVGGVGKMRAFATRAANAQTWKTAELAVATCLRIILLGIARALALGLI
jgi:hypothetical protein